jgi:hypothetical protein
MITHVSERLILFDVQIVIERNAWYIYYSELSRSTVAHGFIEPDRESSITTLALYIRQCNTYIYRIEMHTYNVEALDEDKWSDKKCTDCGVPKANMFRVDDGE